MPTINDTLDYLRTLNVPGVTDASRQYVHTFAWNFVTSQYRDTNSNAYKIFSNALSMGGAGGSAAQLNMRRIIFVLWHAMADAAGRTPQEGWNLATNAANVAAGNIQDELVRTMQKARAVSDVARRRDMAAREIMTNAFFNNPLQFLQENKLFIGGTSRKDATQGDRNVLGFYFAYDIAQDRYEIKPQLVRTAHQEPVPAGAFGFNAVSVPAVLWAQVPGRTNPAAPDANRGSFADIAGTLLDGADYMVTTQFTGCSFCWNTAAGNLLAAHIAPSDAATGGTTTIDATKMARQLAGQEAPNVTAGDFANGRGPGFRVYGKGFGNGTKPNGYPNIPYGRQTNSRLSWMCIIGFRRTGQWELYSQTVQSNDIFLVERIN